VSDEAILYGLIHPSQKITPERRETYREKLTERKAGLKNTEGLR
jgi:hypothetical protein